MAPIPDDVPTSTRPRRCQRGPQSRAVEQDWALYTVLVFDMCICPVEWVIRRPGGLLLWKNFMAEPTGGDEYDMFAMTAAHKTLPLPTYLAVQNLANGREVLVRVNDRGPFLGGRILDLSYMAAKKLGVVNSGTAPVQIRVVATATGRENSSSKTNYSKAQQPVFLQAGSFRLRANADRLKAQLVESGISHTRIVTVEYQENRYYRAKRATAGANAVQCSGS